MHKNALLSIIQHEILLTLRQAYSWLTPLIFFVMIVCLFPLALGADESLIQKSAASVIWFAALLAIILSIGSIFRNDAEDGYLDLYILSPHSLTLLVLCKILSHWITHCLPLILVTPVLGLLLHMRSYEVMVLIITLLLGTPVLSLLGAIGAALIVGMKGNGLLLPVLIMPLYIPILIFGTGTVMTASLDLPINGYFAIMGALSLITLGFAPFLTGVALKIGVDQ